MEDVTVLGDVNVDLNKALSDRGHSCKKMAEELRTRIESRGVMLLIQENTRFVGHQEPS